MNDVLYLAVCGALLLGAYGLGVKTGFWYGVRVGERRTVKPYRVGHEVEPEGNFVVHEDLAVKALVVFPDGREGRVVSNEVVSDPRSIGGLSRVFSVRLDGGRGYRTLIQYGVSS